MEDGIEPVQAGNQQEVTATDGRFKPGQSGNPKGRPPGAGKVAKLREDLSEHLPEIIAQLVAAAKSGDIQAARLVLDRVMPAVKPIEAPQSIYLPEGSLTQQGRSILAAVASGELAPGQGAALIGAVGALARVVEIDEIDRRLTALEKHNDKS